MQGGVTEGFFGTVENCSLKPFYVTLYHGGRLAARLPCSRFSRTGVVTDCALTSLSLTT